ncbi:helix-turn-helix transcriptional regulator [Sphingobium sp. AN558]|uniref:helix-turn-helix transcriptional regulator n=1 Tax=Sphingobium sp. AN558 TaxID=3133442 RepID=UPI0030C54105
MSEYVPSAQLRAGSSTVAADFIAHVDLAVTLESLVAHFSQALGPAGASHACFALEGGERRRLFGETGWGGLIARPETLPLLRFPVTGWDERDYEVEIALFGTAATPEERANLHSMAVLYLCRGIALIDARDEPMGSALTANERFCLAQRRAGLCDLDIAEALDRSVHAVRIHLQRAKLKQEA